MDKKQDWTGIEARLEKWAKRTQIMITLWVCAKKACGGLLSSSNNR